MNTTREMNLEKILWLRKWIGQWKKIWYFIKYIEEKLDMDKCF